jgi:competence protein ComEA
VILNAASADELTRLPGVGKRRAEAIVELRTRLKRFRRVQDLLRVKGIGPRSLKRLMPHMVLDEPVAGCRRRKVSKVAGALALVAMLRPE